MSMTRWLRLGLVAWGGFSAYAAWRQRRGAAATAEPVARWEGEGGAVPVAPDRTAASAVRPAVDEEGARLDERGPDLQALARGG